MGLLNGLIEAKKFMVLARITIKSVEPGTGGESGGKKRRRGGGRRYRERGRGRR